MDKIEQLHSKNAIAVGENASALAFLNMAR